MKAVWLCYTLGILAAATAGFLSPAPWTGFLPVSAGLLWATYDLLEIKDADGNAQTTAARTRRR